MPQSVKVDTKERTLGGKKYNAVGDGPIQNVQTNEDYVDFESDFFAYASADTITVSTINATEYFQAGDKLRIEQTTNRFFTVTRVTSTTIVINTTPDYTLQNAAITKFGMSRLETPLGFTDSEDWTYYAQSDFTFSATNVFSITNFDPTEIFQVGDKIILNQSSTTKYFYVIEVTSTTLTVNAGDDNSYTNNALSWIGSSRIGSPSGHPIIFDISSEAIWSFATPTWTDRSGLFTGGSGTRSMEFYMDGPLMTYIADLGTSSLPANVVAIAITSPFLKRDESSITNKLTGALITGAAGADFHCVYQWSDTSGDGISSELSLYVDSLNTSNFDSGAWGFAGTITVAV